MLTSSQRQPSRCHRRHHPNVLFTSSQSHRQSDLATVGIAGRCMGARQRAYKSGDGMGPCTLAGDYSRSVFDLFVLQLDRKYKVKFVPDCPNPSRGTVVLYGDPSPEHERINGKMNGITLDSFRECFSSRCVKVFRSDSQQVRPICNLYFFV